VPQSNARKRKKITNAPGASFMFHYEVSAVFSHGAAPQELKLSEIY
jgi:hypothetical protein